MLSDSKDSMSHSFHVTRVAQSGERPFPTILNVLAAPMKDPKCSASFPSSSVEFSTNYGKPCSLPCQGGMLTQNPRKNS